VLVDFAALITIDGNLPASAAHHCSFARFDVGDIAGITGGEPILVLLRDVCVLFQVLRSCAQSDPRRIVELCPLMLSALNELVQNDAGDRSVSHAVSRITRRNVDVLVATGILADIRHIVDRLHHLT